MRSPEISQAYSFRAEQFQRHDDVAHGACRGASMTRSAIRMRHGHGTQSDGVEHLSRRRCKACRQLLVGAMSGTSAVAIAADNAVIAGVSAYSISSACDWGADLGYCMPSASSAVATTASVTAAAAVSKVCRFFAVRWVRLVAEIGNLNSVERAWGAEIFEYLYSARVFLPVFCLRFLERLLVLSEYKGLYIGNYTGK
jgi:hypothetical protein